MKIKAYRCRCGSKDFFTLKKSESQVGIYCQSCGKWYKWADKNEKNLIMREMVQRE